jgi:2,3-bisphosphoglycerate-dependent phosphoglycerate mutase
MSEQNGILIMVRHGQSQWNLENRFTGWVDVPLTAEGEAEAKRAGEHLMEYTFDQAFTSALTRAQETLRIILETTGETSISVTRDQALNERHYGDLQGLNKAETAQKFGDEQVHIWRRSYDVPPPNGESLKMTGERTLPFYYANIHPLVIAGKTILVVAHGNSLRSIVKDIEQISDDAIPQLNIPTGVPMVYTISPEGTLISRVWLED